MNAMSSTRIQEREADAGRATGRVTLSSLPYREFDPHSHSAEALRSVLHRLAVASSRSTMLGSAIVHFKEATVAWHRWSLRDQDAIQRLDVNCVLKSLLWSMASKSGMSVTDPTPVIDVDVVLHTVGKPDQIPGTNAGSQPTTRAIAIMYGNAVGVLPGSSTVDAAHVPSIQPWLYLRPGEAMIIDAPYLCVCGWPALHEADCPSVLVELRMHRLVRSGG